MNLIFKVVSTAYGGLGVLAFYPLRNMSHFFVRLHLSNCWRVSNALHNKPKFWKNIQKSTSEDFDNMILIYKKYIC